MLREVMEAAMSMRFEHEWLSEEFVAESQRLAQGENARKHHYVPQMYLRRWAVDGKVQPTQVDNRRVHPPQPAKEVAHERNFYTLPSVDSTMDLPLKWVEKHLSRIESDCGHRLDALEEWGAGVVSDDAVKRDLAVFLGLQSTRTVSNRERTLVLIKAPDSTKREFLKRAGVSAGNLEEAMRNRHADPKHEALDLMIKDVRNVAATTIYRREWAVYRTATPIATCDDPVILVAGPPVSRDLTVGVGLGAAVLYPLNPHQVLVMLRPGLRHRGPYRLDEAETHSVNVEVVGAATKTTFERPGDEIAVNIEVPPRPARDELVDEAAAHLDQGAALQILLAGVAPCARWADPKAAPDWPVLRWYRG